MDKDSRVRVIGLTYDDEEGTDLVAGDTGVIVDVLDYRESDRDIFCVKFDRDIWVDVKSGNIENDGSYQMFRWQLKVIEQEE